MKPKNILIAAILLVSAACYIYFFEMPAAEKMQQAKKPFANQQQGSIKSIAIKNTKNGPEQFKFNNSKVDSDKIELKKKAAIDTDSWGLEGAEYSALDPVNFTALINQLLAYDLGSSLPKEDIDSDMSMYGLSQPELELTVAVADSTEKVLKFSFGKRSEFVGKRYVSLVREDGAKDLYMTDDLLFFAANKSKSDFRRKDPLQIEDTKQHKLLIKSGQFTADLSLEKSDSKVPGEKIQSWQIKSPYQVSADDQKVLEMLRTLKNLKVKDILEKDRVNELKSLMERPLVEVELFDTKEQSTPQLIRIAKRSVEDKEAIISWSKYGSTLFSVEDEKLFSNFEVLDAYRKHAFFKLDTFKIKELSVEESGAVLIVKAIKQDDKWILSGNPQIAGQPADPVFIEEYLQDLGGVSAIEFPAANETNFGFKNPRMKISVILVGDQPDQQVQRTFVVGDEIDFDDDQKGYFAAADDLSEPFIIDQTGLDKLKPRPGTWVQVPTPAPTAVATLYPAG